MLYALCFMLYALFCTLKLCALYSVLCESSMHYMALLTIFVAAFWTTFYGFVDNFFAAAF